MLRLYCRCGYPLWVTARWMETTTELLLLDGTREVEHTQPPLQQCPQCQAALHPDQLEGHMLPPSSAPQPRSDHEHQPPSPPAPPAASAPQSSMSHENQDGAGERSGVVKRLLPQWGPPGASRKPQGTRRVLVVDDDQEVREILQQWLENEGFQVASASDGVEAMRVLQREPGKWVILLDLRMPRMDGWAVLHQLQADTLLPKDHKIVLMSAEWLLAQEGPPWRSPQVVAAVPKPFDLDQMLALLTDLISK